MAESMAEADTQKAAAGDNVLPIYNTTELDDVLYHFMPLAGLGNGRVIQEKLAGADEKLKKQALMFIAKDILTGLNTCHEKGIYHLDIKPENIGFTLQPDGSSLWKLLDLGVVKYFEASGQRTTRYYGTPPYFNAEASRSIKTPGNDIYALGIVIFRLLNEWRHPSSQNEDRIWGSKQYELPPEVSKARAEAGTGNARGILTLFLAGKHSRACSHTRARGSGRVGRYAPPCRTRRFLDAWRSRIVERRAG